MTLLYFIGEHWRFGVRITRINILWVQCALPCPGLRMLATIEPENHDDYE